MSRSAHPPSVSSRRTRLLALPFVALCAVVYLGSALHFALVQHSTCLEHGEAIHVDALQSQARSALLEASFADERIVQDSQRVSLSHGTEAHCTHASLRRESLTPVGSSLLSLEPVTQPRPASAPAQLPHESVARLRLAPKLSPPLS